MPDEGAVATLESPAVDSGLVESSTTTDTSTDTTNSSGTGTTDAIDNSDTPVAGESGHLRGAELYKSVKEKLKASGLSAAEQRSIRNAIHIADKADKLSGGNLEVFETERGILAKLSDDPDAGHTPEQIVQNTLEERKFWRDFDSNFQKADGQIIKDMVAANSESFQKLAPMAMDEFAQVNPEAFSGYVARSAKGYSRRQTDSSQVCHSGDISALHARLPRKRPRRGSDSGHLWCFRRPGQDGKESNHAEKSRGADRTAGNAEPEPRYYRGAYDSRESGGVAAGGSGRGHQNPHCGDESRCRTAKSDAGRCRPQKIRVAVNEEVNTRLSVNERYKQAMRQYLLNGNRKAYVDRATSEQQKIVAGITQRHTQAVIDAKKTAGASKTAQNGNVNGQKTVQNAQPTKDGAGNLIQWLSGHPKTLGKQVICGARQTGCWRGRKRSCRRKGAV